ncbi:NTP transferase domain-containing protein [Paracoccus sp. NGMCC 1.201697]|uniref:NTP transferase domain-containing protein n=1 Tax=Paracoccus broussonetiae subsp. drimophilus TaxID=3373869 RepID=A0ABW7LR94_9RHOB
MRYVAALLAAGRSVRFGDSDKLLAPWQGRPLVSWAAEALAEADIAERVAVVSSPQVADILPNGFTRLTIAPGLPMSRSFRLALDHARRTGADGLLLALGDMPNIDAALLERLLGMPAGGACTDGRSRLPPAFIPAAAFATALSDHEGDFGARAFIAHLPDDQLIHFAAAQALDIDRPEDLGSPG